MTEPEMEQNTAAAQQEEKKEAEKFCKFCGSKIAEDAVICPCCGRQVEALKGSSEGSPHIVINNANSNVNSNVNQNSVAGYGARAKNKWVAFFLCLFLGMVGAHKFYEGKVGMGILYLFTVGLCGIGWLIDCVSLFLKPNPYYV